MVLARQRHRGEIEADGIRRHVADIAQKFDDHIGMAAAHGAIARARSDDGYGGDEPGTPRQPRNPIRHAVEPAVDAAPPGGGSSRRTRRFRAFRHGVAAKRHSQVRPRPVAKARFHSAIQRGVLHHP
jgi:hypothetical protein